MSEPRLDDAERRRIANLNAIYRGMQAPALTHRAYWALVTSLRSIQ